MINREDMLELTRRMTPKRTCIDRIAGGYMDQSFGVWCEYGGAVLISNEALTGINWFPIDGTATGDGSIFYNDVLTWIYKQLYQLNIECDFLWPESEELEKYKLLIVPALYAAPESLLRRIEKFVEQGGHLFTTFKTAFADENLKIYTDCHPHILNKCLGISYSDFTFPDKVKLESDKFRCNRNSVQGFMELINPDTAEVLATYNHYNWKRYAGQRDNNCFSALLFLENEIIWGKACIIFKNMTETGFTYSKIGGYITHRKSITIIHYRR